jgi:hypothetical protein
MQPASLKRLTLVTTIACLLLAAGSPAVAQQLPLSQADRAAMAAITLTASDLPDGYQFAGEGFVSAENTGVTGVDPATLTGAGFKGMYLSNYLRNGATDGMASYVSAWPDAASAEKGFALLEDESVTDPNGNTKDAPLDVGAGSAELTTGTTDVQGTTVALLDATFVVDRYVVGVVVQAPQDAAMDAAGVTDLAKRLEARAQAVAQGQSPDGTDLALPPTVLDLRPLGAEKQAGFVSASEAEALYGVSGSSLGALKTSWVAGVATGADGGGPIVVIAVSSYPDADTAARVVEQSADLAPVEMNLQPVDIAVDGADAVKGYQYASAAAADGTLDSFRGVMQLGTTVVVLDVQGAASIDAAQAAVTDLLAAQVACSGGTCQLPDVNLGS